MKERDVLLLYSGDNRRLARYAVRNRGGLGMDFFRRRLTLINLPELLSGISEGILSYFFPGVKPNINDIYENIQTSLFGNVRKDGLLRFIDGQLFFYPLEGNKKEIASRVDRYLANIPLVNLYEIEDEVPHNILEDPILFSRVQVLPEDELDEKARKILEEIRNLQARYGITVEELDSILGYDIRLSPVHITRNNRILLTDFDGKEVKLDRLSKAVYFLFLRHPEGIRYKELSGYREELLSIYLGLTGRDDIHDINRSIDDLVDPLNNGINVKVSRIKSAFCSAVCDRVARFYYIDGPSGEAKKIQLDRDLVVWEQM